MRASWSTRRLQRPRGSGQTAGFALMASQSTVLRFCGTPRPTWCWWQYGWLGRSATWLRRSFNRSSGKAAQVQCPRTDSSDRHHSTTPQPLSCIQRGLRRTRTSRLLCRGCDLATAAAKPSHSPARQRGGFLVPSPRNEETDPALGRRMEDEPANDPEYWRRWAEAAQSDADTATDPMERKHFLEMVRVFQLNAEAAEERRKRWQDKELGDRSKG
jgi:hypothetical protein